MDATGLVDLAGDEYPDGFWKYGAQTAGAAEEWYDFDFDPATGIGATVDLNTATLTFIDGQKGDHDFDATNGRIAARVPRRVPAEQRRRPQIRCGLLQILAAGCRLHPRQ